MCLGGSSSVGDWGEGVEPAFHCCPKGQELQRVFGESFRAVSIMRVLGLVGWSVGVQQTVLKHAFLRVRPLRG